MTDLEKMTLEELRALARERLGPGHSRSKRADLVRALRDVGAGGSRKGKGAGAAARKGTRAAAGTSKAGGKKKAAAGPGAPRDEGRAKPKGAREAGRTAAPAKASRGGGAKGASRAEPLVPGGPRAPEGADPEGFFVARVRGEEAVRDSPYPMTESAPPPHADEELGEPAWQERLGDLPWGYGDDAFVALPRDPRTLFLYWDLSRETVHRGFEGLDHPRAQLWIFLRSADGWGRLRTVEFALESRGFYVHDLEPGREYRAEIHAVDRHGRERLLARPSNPVALPPAGPSPVVDDRFARIPWDRPLGRMGAGHPGGPFSDEARALLARLSDWKHGTSSEGGPAARGRPSSPSSPFGRPGQGNE